jgi:hypothetical protein
VPGREVERAARIGAQQVEFVLLIAPSISSSVMQGVRRTLPRSSVVVPGTTMATRGGMVAVAASV